MRYKRIVVLSLAAALLASCASIKQQSFELSNGQKVDYIHGKVDADGQTGVFRDAYIDGKVAVSHFAAGQSLVASVLQGTGQAAMMAGGMVGAAAVLRPARYNNHETNNLNNDQDQGQVQGQHQGTEVDTNVISVNTNSNKSSSKSTASALAGALSGSVSGAAATNLNAPVTTNLNTNTNVPSAVNTNSSCLGLNAC